MLSWTNCREQVVLYNTDVSAEVHTSKEENWRLSSKSTGDSTSALTILLKALQHRYTLRWNDIDAHTMEYYAATKRVEDGLYTLILKDLQGVF
jgi:hypothetical protein